MVTLLKQAEANLKGLKPRRAVMPVNPSYTRRQWRTIMAAQNESPKHFPGFKRGTKPQLGDDLTLNFRKLLQAYENNT
jgi:hypothetical protein